MSYPAFLGTHAGWHDQCLLMSLSPLGENMATTMIRQKTFITLLAVLALTACTAERSLAPARPASAISSTTIGPPQLPLLYVVDGVRQAKDRVPVISNDQIARVVVMKGSRALREYGPDASYGVVLITTKLSTPRT